MKMNVRVMVALAALVSAPLAAFDVPRAAVAPVVDGVADDAAWEEADWVAMDQLMLGAMPTPEDFSGRYKLVWTAEHLYLLAEITDDVLYDSHADPLQSYWEDDALEVFVDEDRSGGNHLYDYNAFAYHIALDNQAVDVGPFLSERHRAADERNVRVYPQHVTARWRRSLEQPNRVYWEVRLTVFGDDYRDGYEPGQEVARPVTLSPGKRLGFMLAYCDADGTAPGAGREHFMGDVAIEPVNGDRNLGYIDASVFGEITLADGAVH